MSGRPYWIAISGGSCSGKTALAHALAAIWRGGASILSLDRYYHDLSHLAPKDRDRCNFDDPWALDRGLLLSHLRLLEGGARVLVPEYDFVEHRRTGRCASVGGGSIMIVEGLFALHFDMVRAVADLTVFVDADESVCLARRIARDARERGRAPEATRSQFNETVGPVYRRLVLPTKAMADVVVDGEAPLADAVSRVLAALAPAHRPDTVGSAV